MNENLKELFLEFYDKKYLEQYFALINSLKVSSKKINLIHNDTVFLTYPDSIENLSKLNYFLRKNSFENLFSKIHILPFLESDFDGGFAVIDYKKINSKYGDWRSIKSISRRFDFVFDCILNHTSTSSKWFKKFLSASRYYNNFYILKDSTFNYSNIFRPRTTSLFTSFNRKQVWTTFSEKQVDLNFEEVRVFFSFLKLIYFYQKKGISILRLDAIPYIIKKTGTSCVNLDDTYRFVRLFIESVKYSNPEMKFLSEANFGEGVNLKYLERSNSDMVYDFTFPMLLVYSIYNNDFNRFIDWSKNFDFNNETVFFLSNHDGISFNGLRSFLPKKTFDFFVEKIEKTELKISYDTKNGHKEPYELNSTFYSLLENLIQNNVDSKHYFCFNVLLMIKGVSLVYYLDLIKSRNDFDLFKRTTIKRDLNRSKFSLTKYQERLNNSFFNDLSKLLKIRNALDFENYEFNIYKKDNFLFISYENNDDLIFSISNISDSFSSYRLESILYFDLIESKIINSNIVNLEPYEFKWIRISKDKH